MKINSDIIWAIILLGLTSITFLLGMKKGSMTAEDQLQDNLEEIRILQIKNEQLSEELKSRGVYSYPQANVFSKPQEATAMVLITLNGKDPIKNLSLRRKLVPNFSELEHLNFSVDEISTDLGTLKPHNPSAFPISLSENELAIQLLFETNRKKWFQYIWLKKQTGDKYSSFWIITNENSVIIDKHIDPDFPTDEEGRINLYKGKSITYPDLELNSIFPSTN
ncbi:hypothetical protein [Salinimicrobium xinjiangense]|uniref:hypothetical protein n=1 Tax=Salinimicrobium xinjiangense TaxID=438596 RepID=UPI00048C1A0F|nr:hypothetical protein [Salinimicrobium xinjiangense]